MSNSLRQILTWITLAGWIWYLAILWLPVSFLSSFLKYDIIIVFILFALQILAFSDIKKIIKFKDKDMNLIIIISVTTLICMLLSKSNPGAFFTVLNFCLLWYLSDKWHWSKMQLMAVTIVLTCIAVRWLLFPIPGFNTNGLSAIVTFSMFSIIAMLDYFLAGKKINIPLQICLIILCFMHVWKYKGRGIMLCLIAYVFLRFLIPGTIWISEKAYKVFCYLITLGSIVFVFLYTSVWIITQSKMNDFYIFGKRLFSGREAIWYELWTMFKKQPFIGTGSNITLESWPSVNVHNAMYDVLIINGVFVFLLFVYYLVKKKINLQKINLQNPNFITVMSGIFAVYIEGFSDMDLLWPTLMMVWCFQVVILNSFRVFHEQKQSE